MHELCILYNYMYSYIFRIQSCMGSLILRLRHAEPKTVTLCLWEGAAHL